VAVVMELNDDRTLNLAMLSIFTAAETAHAFSAFMPSHFTIKTFALEGDPAAVAVKLENLRSGYLPATLFGLLLGGVVSVLARSPLPLLASLGASAVMVLNYELAIPQSEVAVALAAPQVNGRVVQWR
jgi:hypothetical protein